jgi:hypothetical protein
MLRVLQIAGYDVVSIAGYDVVLSFFRAFSLCVCPVLA